MLDAAVAFATHNPFNTFIMICAAYYIVKAIIIRGYRTIMVCARGWPPPHLDADGDWKPEPESPDA